MQQRRCIAKHLERRSRPSSTRKMSESYMGRVQSLGCRPYGTMQHTKLISTRSASSLLSPFGVYSLKMLYVALCLILATGARSAPTTSLPTAELFSIEESLGSSAPFEFPEEYSISIEQAIIDRRDFAKAAVLKMMFAMAEDIAHEHQVNAALLDAVDELQKRISQQEETAKILEQHVAKWNKVHGSPTQVKQHEPTSCQDLYQAGHVLSGFYLVRVSDRMETVFCSFADDSFLDTAISQERTSEADSILVRKH